MSSELINALTLLAAELQAFFAAGALVFARVGAIFALVPAFGERVIPVRIRATAALCATVVITPAVLPALPASLGNPVSMALFFIAETLNGLMLAFALRLMIMALQMAGIKAAQSTSLAQAFGGAGADPQPAISRVLTMAGLALAVGMGLPERLALLIVLSYDMFPAGHWPDPASVAHWGTARVAHAFALSFTLAAPFVIGSSLYNLALGAINRAMPQLMVAFVGAPALTFGGLVLLLVSAPLMLTVWASAFDTVLSNPVDLP